MRPLDVLMLLFAESTMVTSSGWTTGLSIVRKTIVRHTRTKGQIFCVHLGFAGEASCSIAGNSFSFFDVVPRFGQDVTREADTLVRYFILICIFLSPPDHPFGHSLYVFFTSCLSLLYRSIPNGVDVDLLLQPHSARMYEV